MGDESTELSVIIPTWNGRELTMAALEHLLGSERSIVAEVLVVDDGSDDDTVDSVCRRCPGVRLIAHTSNRGFGAAVNTGFSAARGQYLAAVNNDVLVSWSCLRHLVSVLRSITRAAAVSPHMTDGSGRIVRVGCDLPRTPWERLSLSSARRSTDATEPAASCLPAEYLKGACVVFDRSALEEVRLFDEQFHMFAEEVDLFRRLAKAGWSSWVIDDISVVHYEGRSSRNHPNDAIAEQFRLLSYRSMSIYYRKHHSAVGATALRATLILQLLGRICRATVRPALGGSDKRRAAELYRCLGQVVFSPPSRPVEPELAPASEAPSSRLD